MRIVLVFLLVASATAAPGYMELLKQQTLETQADTCGKTSLSSISSQIVGGVLAKDGEVPFQISLYANSWGGFSHNCGGSIIDAETIVTAAHCVRGAAVSSQQVRYGSLKHATGTAVNVREIRIHDKYESARSYDIAILKLSTPIPLDSGNVNIGTICLPDAGSDPADGTPVTISGWGNTMGDEGSSPADLRHVTVPTVNRATCIAAYAPTIVDETMLCAAEAEGGKDSCQGDSGGPLFSVDGGVATLHGVVSWGRGCAQKGYPGVYAAVGNLRSWIDANRY